MIYLKIKILPAILIIAIINSFTGINILAMHCNTTESSASFQFEPIVANSKAMTCGGKGVLMEKCLVASHDKDYQSGGNKSGCKKDIYFNSPHPKCCNVSSEYLFNNTDMILTNTSQSFAPAFNKSYITKETNIKFDLLSLFILKKNNRDKPIIFYESTFLYFIQRILS